MTRVQPGDATTGAGPSRSARLTPPPASILWGVAIVITTLLVYLSRELVLLLFFSASLAYLLNPLVKMAESAAIRRELAVTGLFITLVVTLLLAAYFLVPRLRAEVSTLSGNWPSFTERLHEAIDGLPKGIYTAY